MLLINMQHNVVFACKLRFCKCATVLCYTYVSCLVVPLVGTCSTYNNIEWQKINYHPLLKFSVILIVLTLVNLNMTAKLLYHVSVLRRMDSIKNLCS